MCQSVFTQSSYLNLSKNPETLGFDLQAGQLWIYPTNYPIRDYQYNIIQKALLKNTLVSLPTGLGKTFIAAVVMYNYFRWYPQGKVVFMAPTKPLVKQQVDACYDIMAIPKEVTAELTGTQVSKSREEIWTEKRVFFITPQILQNDLERIQGLGAKIRCVVFDEAHRAKGNHAYCEVIKKLVDRNKYFRVLALSATPGGSINDVLEVVKNLLISHLEFRTEESLDVSPYVFQRNLTTVVVPLGDKLQQVKDEYMKILDYHTRNLVKYNVVQGNCGNLTKGRIFVTMKNYQMNAKNSSANYAEIMRSLNTCVTLYHAFELLVRHGLRSFLNFYEEHIGKPLLRGNYGITEIMDDVRQYLGPAAQLEEMPDGGYPEVSKDVKFGHPKFYKLRDILVGHFKGKGDSSRVIVFFEYRDSVKEAYALLLQSRPILKPRIFLGQSKGVTQRQQLNVVKSFREGNCNVLLSTSIGEEGLDVGEVDLIVCFDISNKSPIRMVQRMGRTGRKKEGNIVVLVTEGKEQQTLKDCLIHKNNVAAHVLGSRELAKGLSTTCPRLVPEDISPKCEKIFITVKKPVLPKNSSSLKDMFRTISSSSSEPNFSQDIQIIETQERLPPTEMLFNKENPLEENGPRFNIFSKRIEKQRSFQETYKIRHSKSSEILVEMLQIADSKRFNIPMSQIGTSSQSSQNKNLKQADIRNMFFKSQSANDFVIPSTQVPRVILTAAEEKSTFGSRELFMEISNFLSIEMTNITKKCKICPEQVDCTRNCLLPRPAATLNWIELDHSVFSSLTVDDLKSFAKTFDKANPGEFDFDDTLDFNMLRTPCQKSEEALSKGSQNVLELEDLIDRSILTDIFEKSFSFQPPNTMNILMSKYQDMEASQKNTQPVKDNIEKLKKEQEIIGQTKVRENIGKRKEEERNMWQGEVEWNIERVSEVTGQKKVEENIGKEDALTEEESKETPDLFESSPKETVEELLSFFKLDSLIEIFGVETDFGSSQATIIYSPDIFQQSPVLSRTITREKTPPLVEIQSSDEGSPIICTFQVKKKGKNPVGTTKVPKLNVKCIQGIDSPSNFTMNSTKLCSTPISGKPSLEVQRKPVELCESPKSARKENNDIFQRSNAEIVNNNYTPKRGSESTAQSSSGYTVKHAPRADLDDLCDFSFFGLPSTKSGEEVFVTPQQIENQVDKPKNSSKSPSLLEVISLSDSYGLADFCDMSLIEALPKKSQENQQKGSQTGTKQNNAPSSSKLCSPTQVSITQMISLVNKECTPQLKNSSTKLPWISKKNLGKQKKSSQKENADKNIPDVDDSDFFNFSFNKKKPVSKKPTKMKTGVVKEVSPVKDTLGLGIDLDKSIRNLALNMSVHSNPSDDEFETKPTSPVWIRPKPKPLKQPKGPTDNQIPKISCDNNNRVKKRKKNPFIEDEAELSFGEESNISEDEEDEKELSYDASFVGDESHVVGTQMHAMYLQSVRSPVLPNRIRRPGNYNINVFSQEVNEEEEDSYLDDSFVVDEETIPSQKELTELEILEKELEEQRKRRKKKALPNPSKRRRIIQESDSE
ncbi:hypothetical protein JTB14_020076 [Gonioctena quinquepunctata]|nr:hypothetical protein JTB14_020076 [Gonioctena quinquepunctata]